MRLPLVCLWLLADCGLDTASATERQPADQGALIAPVSPRLPVSRDICATNLKRIPSEGSVHIPLGATPTYLHNPPTSGPHYRTLWAGYGEHSQAVPRPVWLHNLEHGAVVFLYRPDAPPSTLTALREVFEGLPDLPACGSPMAVMTPDPELETSFAVVAWDWMLTGACVDAPRVRRFALERRGRSPQLSCADGDY
jgi:hypothetical protein